jgi:hypothetical protein
MTVTMSRTLKRWICGLLIGVFASAQVAAAVHACSGLASGAPSAFTASAGSSQMMASNHDRMDSMLSNVCVGHCQDGFQNTDRPPLSAVPAAVLVGFYTMPQLAESSTRATPRPWASPDPPHAILHCCMRD